jgi:hypothetical protein
VLHNGSSNDYIRGVMVAFERIQYIAIITLLFTLCGFMAYKSEGMRQERVDLQMDIKRLERDSIITHELLNRCATNNRFDLIGEVLRVKDEMR